MKSVLPQLQGKKLTVTYRVEPGCLGPDGADKIDAFCVYAQQQVQLLDLDYVSWSIIPRNDKSLPELEFDIDGKRMSDSQAERYFSLFGKSVDDFDASLSDELSIFIDGFLAR